MLVRERMILSESLGMGFGWGGECIAGLLPQSLQLEPAGDVGESRLMSQVGIVREVVCA